MIFKYLYQIRWTLLKVFITSGLLVWLVRSGRLDLAKVAVFWENPALTVTGIVTWIVVSNFLLSARWKLILAQSGFPDRYRHILAYNQIGLFFNTIMPGAIGGDLIRALYVMKSNPAKSKTDASMTLLMDRALGMMGLFLMGMGCLLFADSELLTKPSIMSLFYSSLGLATLGFTILLVPLVKFRGQSPVTQLLALPLPGFRFIRKVYGAFCLYYQRPVVILQAIGLSVLIQLLNMSYMYLIAQALLDEPVSLAALALIFPLGTLATTLPLAPAGLGVGHVAFDQLFTMVGLSSGADVFNIFALTLFLCNLSGVFCYLLYRGQINLPPSGDRSLSQC